MYLISGETFFSLITSFFFNKKKEFSLCLDDEKETQALSATRVKTPGEKTFFYVIKK